MFKNSRFVAVMVAVLVLPSIASALPAEAAVYSAPSLVSPSSNQVLTNYPRVATFNWSAVSGASSYQLEIACDTCVSKTNLYANAKTYAVSGTSYTVQVPGSDNTFRWRVRGKDSSSYGPWSSYRYFSYKTGGSTTVTAPLITSPANGASFPVDSNVYFAWTYAATNIGVSYDLIIEKSNGSSWQSYKTNQIWYGLTSTNMKMTEAGSYRAKIRTVTNNGGSEAYGAWSNYVNFTINSGEVLAPTVINPYENKLINQYSRNVYMSWTAVTGADGYRIQIWRDGASGSQTIDVVNGGIDYTYTATADDDWYHFKVTALKRSSSYSDYYVYSNWSNVRNFRYVYYNSSNTGIPTLIAPADESTVNSNGVSLDWSTVSGATSYEYQVTRYNGTDWVSVSAGTVADSNAYVTLPYSTYGMYSFRVRAIDDGVYGSWSNYNQFYYYGGSGYN